MIKETAPDYESPFDHLGFDSKQDKDRYIADRDAKYRHYNDLIYRAFSTDAGRALFEEMKRQTMMLPIVAAGTDLFSMGKVEGKNEFVRSIILTMEKVEGEDNG